MEAKQTMLILSGLPGSGKSKTAHDWVKEPGENPRGRINYDDLRQELFGPNFVWNRADEEKMKQTAILRAERLIESGYDIVVDNCNLHEGARAPWKAMARKYSMVVEQQEIDTPVQSCIDRDRKRVGRSYVGRAVIERMALFNGFIDWTDKHVYPRDFIVVDMDGTIADCGLRRKLAFSAPIIHKDILVDTINGTSSMKCTLDGLDIPKDVCPNCGARRKKDWDLFYQDVEADPPIPRIIELVRKLSGEYDVLMVTGRPTDKAGKGSEAWLDLHLDSIRAYRHLFMRAAMDRRPDFIVKKEILDLLPKDRIKFVLDDRDQVVKMWRENGLTCLQVAEGDF